MASPSASGVSLFSRSETAGIFLSSGGKTSSKTIFVAVCNVSLQLAGGLFTFRVVSLPFF